MGSRGGVRIMASESALLAFVPKVLATFNQRHSNIRVDLESEGSPTIVRAVTVGVCDVGIFWGATSAEGLRVTPCYTDRLVFVEPLIHPLAQPKSTCFSDLLEFIEREINSAVEAKLAAVALGEPWAARQYNLCSREPREANTPTRMPIKHVEDSTDAEI